MDSKIKNEMIILLIIGVVAMTIIYATITRRPDIRADLKGENNTAGWSVRFNYIDNGDSILSAGYAVIPENTKLEITEDSTLVVLPRVILKAPGDRVDFKFKVENNGDIDAIINDILEINFNDVIWDINESLSDTDRNNLVNDIKVSFTYGDGSSIGIGDKLTTGSSKDLMVSIEYVKRDTPQVLPSHDVIFKNITAALIYGQDMSE